MWIVGVLLFTGLAFVLPRALVVRATHDRIHSPLTAPPRPVAIVFGAGLRRDGTPSQVLADRVTTAAALYLQGRVQSLLLTGSALSTARDEPAAMRELALALGVPDQAIRLDRQGDRTYLSCQRARSVFGVDRALLVTQRFHLPRALAICAGMGIQADGVSADLSPYSRRAQRFWNLREIPATFAALLETYLVRPGTPPASRAG